MLDNPVQPGLSHGELGQEEQMTDKKKKKRKKKKNPLIQDCFRVSLKLGKLLDRIGKEMPDLLTMGQKRRMSKGASDLALLACRMPIPGTGKDNE